VPATVPATPSRAIPAATHHAAAPATTATHPTQTSQPGHDVFERVGASATGVDGSVTLTPGQRVHLQFTLDQTSQVVFSERDGNTLNFDIFTDHGQPSDSINYDTSIPYRPGALVAGPHTITIENVGSTPGTLPFTLYASTDQTRTVKASPTGVDDALTLAPGQHVDLEFTLDQPSEVVLSERDGNTLNFDISTDHGQPSNSLNYDTSIPYEAGTLAAGPHTITIENVGSTPGTLPYTLLTHPA
jgi:hypothetical protein